MRQPYIVIVLIAATVVLVTSFFIITLIRPLTPSESSSYDSLRLKFGRYVLACGHMIPRNDSLLLLLNLYAPPTDRPGNILSVKTDSLRVMWLRLINGTIVEKVDLPGGDYTLAIQERLTHYVRRRVNGSLYVYEVKPGSIRLYHHDEMVWRFPANFTYLTAHKDLIYSIELVNDSWVLNVIGKDGKLLNGLNISKGIKGMYIPRIAFMNDKVVMFSQAKNGAGTTIYAWLLNEENHSARESGWRKLAEITFAGQLRDFRVFSVNDSLIMFVQFQYSLDYHVVYLHPDGEVVETDKMVEFPRMLYMERGVPPAHYLGMKIYNGITYLYGMQGDFGFIGIWNGSGFTKIHVITPLSTPHYSSVCDIAVLNDKLYVMGNLQGHNLSGVFLVRIKADLSEDINSLIRRAHVIDLEREDIPKLPG